MLPSNFRPSQLFIVTPDGETHELPTAHLVHIERPADPAEAEPMPANLFPPSGEISLTLTLDENAQSLFRNLDAWAQDPRIQRICRDIASLNGNLSPADIIERLHRAFQPSIEGLLDLYVRLLVQRRPRWQIRRWKQERRQARHAFLSHGKHGRKGIRGKRNVPR